jgi:formylglycine-generating enzyme required for sulfatase activity
MAITLLKVASSLVAAALVPAGLAGSTQPQDRIGSDARALPAAATVIVVPGSIMYRPPGEFLRGGHPEAAVPRRLAIDEPIQIMTYQVSSAEYALCVAAGACRPASDRSEGFG